MKAYFRISKSLRLIARFNYWSLILSDSLPKLPKDTKAVISGIHRLRMGQENISVAIVHSNENLNLVINEKIQIERKEKILSNFFLMYEFFVFKNRFFAWIIYLSLPLFMVNKLGFKLALCLLYHLLRDGNISLKNIVKFFLSWS